MSLRGSLTDAIAPLTRTWTRRIIAGIVVLLLLVNVVVRLRAYVMTRQIQAVLRGLSELRLDQTTEDQVQRIVPHVSYRDWQNRGVTQRAYYARVTNEDDPMARLFFSDRFKSVAEWFGYRYMSFDAGMLVEQGKVTQISYGVANQWVRPQAPGYAGYIVSARSVHGFWLERQYPFGISSSDDYNPQYHIKVFRDELGVIYTDASSDTTDRIFNHLDLSCFWGLRACDDPHQVGPAIWHDVETIRRDTDQQLISGRCPDSIIEGRMKYLPDISVLLLEVTGSRRIPVNEEGDRAEDWFTDYKLNEVIRGRSYSQSFNNVRFRRQIPSATDPSRTQANQIWPETKIGAHVLYFNYPVFASCRFIPATASALQLARTIPPPPKRREDQIVTGLQ